jgi:integrase
MTMSPSRTSKDGCFRFDRIFPSVGRITSSSGTRRRAEFRHRDALLSRLYDAGRLDLLRALREKRLRIQDLVLADREERLSAVASDLLTRRPLWAEVDRVLAQLPAGATVTRYRGALQQLRDRGPLGPTATVADLARVDWRALNGVWGKSAADWNHVRRAVSRFLTVALDDKWHPLRRAVLKHFPIRTEVDREPDLLPADFLRILNHVPKPLRPAYWTLVILGLRIGEFCRLQPEHLRPRTTSVTVPGTKTRGSARVLPVDPRLWPWIVAAVPCPVTHWRLRAVWRRRPRGPGVRGSGSMISGTRWRSGPPMRGPTYR